MAVDLSFFDANNVDKKTDFQVLPEDYYPVIFTDAEMEENSKKNGHFMKLSVQVTEGQHRGSTTFDRLNLDNPNATAVKIAEQTLSSICHALGILQPKSSDDLLRKPLIAHIVVKEREDKPGQYSNEVKNYYAIGEKKPGSAPVSAPAAAKTADPMTAAATPIATTVAPTAGKKPWQK